MCSFSWFEFSGPLPKHLGVEVVRIGKTHRPERQFRPDDNYAKANWLDTSPNHNTASIWCRGEHGENPMTQEDKKHQMEEARNEWIKAQQELITAERAERSAFNKYMLKYEEYTTYLETLIKLKA